MNDVVAGVDETDVVARVDRVLIGGAGDRADGGVWEGGDDVVTLDWGEGDRVARFVLGELDELAHPGLSNWYVNGSRAVRS